MLWGSVLRFFCSDLAPLRPHQWDRKEWRYMRYPWIFFAKKIRRHPKSNNKAPENTIRCLEKGKTYSSKWWLNGELPWYKVQTHVKQIEKLLLGDKSIWDIRSFPTYRHLSFPYLSENEHGVSFITSEMHGILASMKPKGMRMEPEGQPWRLSAVQSGGKTTDKNVGVLQRSGEMPGWTTGWLEPVCSEMFLQKHPRWYLTNGHLRPHTILDNPQIVESTDDQLLQASREK